jgi:hypothetical protein
MHDPYSLASRDAVKSTMYNVNVMFTFSIYFRCCFFNLLLLRQHCTVYCLTTQSVNRYGHEITKGEGVGSDETDTAGRRSLGFCWSRSERRYTRPRSLFGWQDCFIRDFESYMLSTDVFCTRIKFRLET